MKEKITCAYCDGVAVLKKEKKEIKYRKDVFTILAHFYQCDSCEERFTNCETDTLSLLQLHNQYREKYHIPFPDEIADLRNNYNLSASKMSEVLGLGANGYSNYENGEIPTLQILTLDLVYLFCIGQLTKVSITVIVLDRWMRMMNALEPSLNGQRTSKCYSTKFA
jgi:hypothetical protein